MNLSISVKGCLSCDTTSSKKSERVLGGANENIGGNATATSASGI